MATDIPRMPASYDEDISREPEPTSGNRETIPHDLLVRAFEDAWSYREQLANGYWCSECDKEASKRCETCRADFAVMGEYEKALAALGAEGWEDRAPRGEV